MSGSVGCPGRMPALIVGEVPAVFAELAIIGRKLHVIDLQIGVIDSLLLAIVGKGLVVRAGRFGRCRPER